MIEAERIAREAHEGQFDKAGRPYVEHPARVAAWAARLDPDAPSAVIEAAWLHDVLEDTPFTRDDLAARGISAEAIAMVEAVTKRDGEPVEAYFERVRACPGAADVKRADLADNTDPARLALLDADRRAKLEAKYARAFGLLGIPPVHGAGQ
ncbi:MAG: HD domain-containing protein [Microbacteriaceae bacterium]|nr:HD domain-containing protein [Microbacteriaceae bacterium]